MITKKTINGHEFTFVNTSKNTRNGFAHLTEVYEDNYPYRVADAKCNYYNRTWECYQFQSVMKSAIYDKIERIELCAKKNFLSCNGWKVLTKKRKELFEEAIKYDDEFNLYNALYASL